MKCDPAIEIFAYHQEMHTSLELLRDQNILDFLIQNIEYYVTNLNGYFAATLKDDKIVKGFWVRPSDRENLYTGRRCFIRESVTCIDRVWLKPYINYK